MASTLIDMVKSASDVFAGRTESPAHFSIDLRGSKRSKEHFRLASSGRPVRIMLHASDKFSLVRTTWFPARTAAKNKRAHSVPSLKLPKDSKPAPIAEGSRRPPPGRVSSSPIQRPIGIRRSAERRRTRKERTSFGLKSRRAWCCPRPDKLYRSNRTSPIGTEQSRARHGSAG
jgi:hypothetical protein